MGHAGALVGNSSAAVVEAMSVAVPVVNIGDRQRGREQLARWINVDYHRDQIRQAIETGLYDETYRLNLRKFSSELALQDTTVLVLDFLRQLDLAKAHQPKQFLDWSEETLPVARG
jgi:UDP-N-acetylglucosamine 2-epimerase